MNKYFVYEEALDSEEWKNGMMITGYTGSQAVVRIPARIGGKTVRKVAAFAFRNNEAVEKIVLPRWCKVLHILDKCPGLQEIEVPAGMEYIVAPRSCPKLKTWTVDPVNPYYKVIDGVLFSADMQWLIDYPAGLEAESYTVPAGVQGIERIENANLRHLELPGSLRDVVSLSCPNLTELKIPEGMRKLGGDSLYGCSGLQRLELPATLEKIWAGALNVCHELREIRVAEGNPNFYTEDGMLLARNYRTYADRLPVEGTALLRYPNDGSEEVHIPADIRTVAAGAFDGHEAVRRIFLPKGIEVIEQDAFCKCPQLEAVVYPRGQELTDRYCFRDCTQMNEKLLPIEYSMEELDKLLEQLEPIDEDELLIPEDDEDNDFFDSEA